MAEHDLTSTLEDKQLKQLLERLKLWEEKSSAIPTPEEALRLEKREFAAKLREARGETSRYASKDPEALARFDEALDRTIICAVKLAALEVDCGCPLKAKVEACRQEHARMRRKYGLRIHLSEEDLRVTSPSPSPIPTSDSLISNLIRNLIRNGTSPPSNADGNPAEEPISPPPSGSFPPGPARDNRGGEPSPEQDRGAPGVEPTCHSGQASSATETTISVGGVATVADDVRPGAADARTASSKRKAPPTSLICTLQFPPKRQRLHENENSTTPNGNDQDDHDSDEESEADFGVGSDADPDYQAEASPAADEVQTTAKSTREPALADVPRLATPREIKFQDLYQGGNAHFKHHIVLCDGDFYIFRCDDCGMHFNDNPTKGVGTHLSFKHGRLSRRLNVAVRACGIKVLDCDLEKQERNNDAFDEALHNGYVPKGNPNCVRKLATRQKQPKTASKARYRQQRADGALILSPAPGKIYLAHWTEFKQDGVIILPRGNAFGDPSFADVFLDGTSLVEDTDLLDSVPDCYRTCPETGTLVGWQDGYEDGGEKVRDRIYPVMRFDGVPGFRKRSVDWIRVTDLREYDPEILAGTGGLIENAVHIRQFEKERERARETRQRGENNAVQDRRSVTTDPGLPDYTPSPPPAQPTDASREREMTVANEIAGTQPVPEGPSPDASGEDQNNEGASAVPDTVRTAIRPNQDNIVGHAATVGNGVPNRQHSTLSSVGPGNNTAGPDSRDPQKAMSTAPNHLRGLEPITEEPDPQDPPMSASTAFNHFRGPYGSLGSENAALMSRSVPPGFIAPPITDSGVPPGEPNPLPHFFLRPAASATPMNPPGSTMGGTTRNTTVVRDGVNGQGAYPQGPTPEAAGDPTHEQGPASEQAQPITGIPQSIQTKMQTSEPQPSQHQTGGTQDTPIVIDDGEEPPARHPYGKAKRTPNWFSPFKRSFDHKSVVSQGTTAVPQPQTSAAQESVQGPSQELGWLEAAMWSVPTAPDAQMGANPPMDGSDIDFDAYIGGGQGM